MNMRVGGGATCQSCGQTMPGTSVALDVTLIGELVNALEWCDTRYRQTLASKSVGDVDEMRAYANATLTAARARLSEGTDRS